MAHIYTNSAVPFAGRMGSYVGYLWKGRACIRAYHDHVNYPNTPDQQKQRDWFVSMVRFASKATTALRLGLHQKAEEYQMTEGNLFIKNNKQHFRTGKHGVEVAYEHLVIAEGSAADVYFKSASFEANETVAIPFERNAMALRSSGSDKVYVYFYAPALDKGFLSAPSERRSKIVRVQLPEEWAGTEVHLYGFVVDKEGRASSSTYIGIGCVNHYEERGRYIPINKGWDDFVGIATEANASTPKEHSEASPLPSHKPNLFADMAMHAPPE